ncbi:MAG TPA: type II toxin-antitoxin system Phd/YefM family antitoxin, partial [Candidatus Elarobacter sp.]|nr:type II toxin-antitoxin system Phd/YefM family antitoxin [Candidatus Elarobacter sp.]
DWLFWPFWLISPFQPRGCPMSPSRRRSPQVHESTAAEYRAVPTPITITITATDAQNEFGRVLDLAARDQVVIITRHDTPRAVLISTDRFRALAGAEAVMLDSLAEEFDALLERMQTPQVRAGTARGFKTTPREMGRAAVRAARRDRDE